MHALLVTVSVAILGQVTTPQKQEIREQKEQKFAKEQTKLWEELYRSEAAEYMITIGGFHEMALTFRPKPVLIWNNPVRRGETNGAMFVWTRDGRAEVVGTVFSYLSRDFPVKRHLGHSFHSLSTRKIVAERDENVIWSINAPGFKFKEIPDAPVPANTAELRLTQMVDLAKEFSATTTLEGKELELELLPEPLYRNEKASADVIDGALFTLATGTDPELLLMIEARGPVDKPVWHYGAGRFTDLAFKLTHRKAVVWTNDDGLQNSKELPYLSVRTTVRDVILP